MKELNLSQIILQTILETGNVATSPIRFVPENNTWIFWDETWSIKSEEYQTMDDALIAFRKYCETYIENEISARGITG